MSDINTDTAVEQNPASYVFPVDGKSSTDGAADSMAVPELRARQSSASDPPDAQDPQEAKENERKQKQAAETGYPTLLPLASIRPDGRFAGKKGPNQRDLHIATGTWNMHAKDPPGDTKLREFVPFGYDLYVLATQECERSIEMSLLIRSKAKWTATLTRLLGEQYYEVAQENLQAIHIIAFAKKKLRNDISLVSVGQVATGFMDYIGNKGATAISFDIGSTSLLFIGCHFTAFHGKVVKRNADYKKINERLPNRKSAELPVEAHKRFDHVFWMGDLNYRINGNRELVDALLKLDMQEVLIANDQLNIERHLGNVFVDFVEAPVKFLPTYKFDTGWDRYDSSRKKRIPSWTDRILFKPSPNLVLTSYTSVATIRTSDHRPVVGTFVLRHDGFDEHKRSQIGGESGSTACTIM
jgi:phosphatidylinositol-bisphosphatase